MSAQVLSSRLDVYESVAAEVILLCREPGLTPQAPSMALKHITSLAKAVLGAATDTGSCAATLASSIAAERGIDLAAARSANLIGMQAQVPDQTLRPLRELVRELEPLVVAVQCAMEQAKELAHAAQERHAGRKTTSPERDCFRTRIETRLRDEAFEAACQAPERREDVDFLADRILDAVARGVGDPNNLRWGGDWIAERVAAKSTDVSPSATPVDHTEYGEYFRLHRSAFMAAARRRYDASVAEDIVSDALLHIYGQERSFSEEGFKRAVFGQIRHEYSRPSHKYLEREQATDFETMPLQLTGPRGVAASLGSGGCAPADSRIVERAEASDVLMSGLAVTAAEFDDDPVRSAVVERLGELCCAAVDPQAFGRRRCGREVLDTLGERFTPDALDALSEAEAEKEIVEATVDPKAPRRDSHAVLRRELTRAALDAIDTTPRKARAAVDDVLRMFRGEEYS